VFFGCSNYSKTQCDFVSWDRPIPKPCPTCGAPFIVQKVSKAGTRLRCTKPECDYTADGEAEGGEAPPASSSTPTGPASSVG
jgi:DNA topoisomerase-1